MTVYLCLLRGVNVGGHNRLPMDDLRESCAAAGLGQVDTYIQSGNVLLDSGDGREAVEARLEAVIADGFGLEIPVIARSAETWASYIEANPMEEATTDRPKRVRLCVSKAQPADGALGELRKRAGDERIEERAGALWIDRGPRGADAELTTSVIDRVVGSTVTMRNWNTVLELQELAAAR